MEVLSDSYQQSQSTLPPETKAEVLDSYSTCRPIIISSDIVPTKFTLDNFRSMKRSFPDESDETIARFLIGKNDSVKLASELLAKHIEWRKSNLPLRKQNILKELATGKLYSYGVDKGGRPLIIFTPRFNNPKERDVNEMVCVYHIVIVFPL